MGFFKDLWKVTTGKKKSAFSVLSGARTIRGLLSGKETFSSAFAKDYDWILGDNSMFGSSDEQKAAQAIDLKQQQEAQAKQQEQFETIQGLYNQGFSSVGMGGENAALQLQGPKNSGLSNQDNKYTYNQHQQGLTGLYRSDTNSGLYNKSQQIGLNQGGGF